MRPNYQKVLKRRARPFWHVLRQATNSYIPTREMIWYWKFAVQLDTLTSDACNTAWAARNHFESKLNPYLGMCGIHHSLKLLNNFNCTTANCALKFSPQLWTVQYASALRSTLWDPESIKSAITGFDQIIYHTYVHWTLHGRPTDNSYRGYRAPPQV